MDPNVSQVTKTQAYITSDQSGGQKGRFTTERGAQKFRSLLIILPNLTFTLP